MISTLHIRKALEANLAASSLFERVIAHSTANLGEALTHLRDSPDSIAIIIPGEDRFEHEFVPGTNQPVRTEVKNNFELVISARSLAMPESGVDDALDFKDAALARLLWDDLSVPGLICIPVLCEPMIVSISDDNSAGREAWKITLEMRHEILG